MKLNLRETFGNIDIYLFDQLLKGRFNDCQTILDAGCGKGRNVVYFLQNHYQVYGIDPDPVAIAELKQLAKQIAPHYKPENFQVCSIEALPFKNNAFDLVICSAVLHFARSHHHFEEMLYSLWRVLHPGGFLFARLASSMGIEHLVQPTGNGRYQLPDGSERFLVTEQLLLQYTAALHGDLYEPIKTTNVQNLRCMTTWCLQKRIS